MPDSLETLRVVLDERHTLYMAKFDSSEKAVASALAAQEKQVAAAFASSEKAIGKSEEAQHAYNERSNEFRGQLDDQAKTLMPRAEAIQRLDTLDKATGELQRGESRGVGGVDALAKARQQMNWIIGIAIMICGIMVSAIIGSLGVIGGLVYFLIGKH